MNRFPVIRRLVVQNYRLYPGTPDCPGIDFDFVNGISVLAGINGLGKTTLINLLFRMLVGPYELPKDAGSARFGSAAKANVIQWQSRTRFFPQRVADRAKDAWAELWFSIGETHFSVKRSLATLSIQSWTMDGQPMQIGVKEEPFQNSVCLAADAGQFVDYLTAVKYLTFFNEERRDILWDDQAQRQFYRILFTTPDEARDWIKLEQEISSADSRARNISASVFQLEADLKAGEALLVNNAGVDARLTAEQALLDADLQSLEELEARAETLDGTLKSLRRDLERAKLFEDAARRTVEEIRFTRLGSLFPTLTETSQYILTQLYSEGRCLACDQHSPEAQKAMQTALESKNCVVCGLNLKYSPRYNEGVAAPVSSDDFDAARLRLEASAAQRQALTEEEHKTSVEWGAVLNRLGELSANINSRRKDVDSLRKQLPPDPEELATLRSSIEELKNREQTEKRRRQGAEALYERLLGTVNDRIETAAAKVSVVFQKLIERFLEESCSLTFKTISDRPSQSGRMFQYPSLRFEMTAAAFEGQQIRSSPDDVSESQREFIDLAYRMALSDVAAVGGAISMVIETPEASLDVIFMERAAEMLRAFASDARSIVVTSNLTSSVMIPALVGPFTADPEIIASRRERVLNLLEIAAPNAAVQRHRADYAAFLETGLKGYHP